MKSESGGQSVPADPSQSDRKRRSTSDNQSNLATFTYNAGSTLIGNALFDNDLATIFEFEKNSTDTQYNGTLKFNVQFSNNINFNAMVLQVPEKHLDTFDGICLYVEDEKIVCSYNTYASKGDYILFEAPQTLVAKNIRLEWPMDAKIAAAAELVIVYGEL